MIRKIDTAELLRRAAEIDPEAWSPPLLKKLGRRREVSVARALKKPAPKCGGRLKVMGERAS